jgi:hypothetical protein
MSVLKPKENTFVFNRRRYFDKRIEKYLITLKGGTIYYDGISIEITYFIKCKFNDLEYIKILTHRKTPYKVFKLCWAIHVEDDKDILNIRIEKREF